MKLWKILLTGLFLLSIVGCGATTPKYQIIRPIDNPKAAPDFTLIDQRGQPFHLRDQQGKVVVLFFGFTSCPDVCPTALGVMMAAKRAMGDVAQNMVVAFVTVDPERDTPKQLGRYMDIFDSSFYGLSGDPETLATIRKEYGVYASRVELPDSALGYTMDHTAGLFIVDQQQRWFAMAEHNGDPALLAQDLSQLATVK